MRRLIATAAIALAILVTLPPPGFAQAPSPKVTLSGLFDQVTALNANLHDGNFTRTSDRIWYARTRFRPDLEFAVGRVKAVLGVEIDLAYGQFGPNDGGFPGNSSNNSGCPFATTGCMDLNTDVAGIIEVKWIYTEFPLTGKDSLLPFIPVTTMARAGGQPFSSLASYKLAAYANGDFAGVSAITTVLPNLKTDLAWVVVEDEIAGANRGAPAAKTGRGEDYALISSLEYSPVKGLDFKPLFSWFHADGQTSSNARRNLTNRNTAGGTLNAAAARGASAAGSPSYHENRYTIGVDARWRIGGFGLDPTFYFQWGSVDSNGVDTSPGSNGFVKKVSADISSWLFDVIGSYQLGPLLLQARGMYSPGNKARDDLTKRIGYYSPLDTDNGFYAADWTAFFASWSSGDYFATGWSGVGNYIGYDRYGIARVTLRGTYNFTPAFSTYVVVGPTFTAEAVDTDTNSQRNAGGLIRLTTSQNSWTKGDSNYLGTELDGGIIWRFSPNVAFNLVGGILFAGSALDTAECITASGAAGNAACSNGTVFKRDAENAYSLAARLRLAF